MGHLNFSSGVADAKFLYNLNQLYRAVHRNSLQTEALPILCRWLTERITTLERAGGAFSETTQARTVVHLLENELLPAYREFHQDLLFHQDNSRLWNAFFVGRAIEALLLQGSPWEDKERIVSGALSHLNDYVGYRPVATLSSGNACEPYPNEFIRPVPLFVRDAGVACGEYEKILQLALEILSNTDEEILAQAWFDLERLEEISLDPRAYDFDHPANRRPNHHFGQWDARHITKDGYYSRFVLQQITLDALLSRCRIDDGVGDSDSEQQLRDRFEDAACVLAGTMLMASGTSGDGPGRHDSNTTLSTLLPHIASYRDAFYQQLLTGAPGDYGIRLQDEAERYHQPFGAARQHLNHELARRRALQMQYVHLAHLFARLGFPKAAQLQADSVLVASARMVSAIYCRLTEGHDAIDNDQLERVVDCLTECESLIQRAIGCGALVDPWNIVGFAGNFSLFPSLENTVHDWRVDELIELVEQVLDLCARAWSEAAAIDNAQLEEQFSSILTRLALWWDRYASSTVEDLKRLEAKEIEVSANLVAGALNAWHKAGAAAGDIGFWRMFVDQFDSSKAFQLVIEALLDHGDTVASRALMMQWVSQKERTPLEEGDSSFRRMAFHWLSMVESQERETEEDQWPQISKFFAYLEANAEEYWQVPSLELDASLDSMFDDVLDEIDGAIYFDDEEDDDDLAEEELFEAAYEEMVYRDSSDDGHEGEIADEGVELEHSEWEYEVHRLEQRLDFLTTTARMWKHAAIAWGTTGKRVNSAATDSSRTETLDLWLKQACTNYGQLVDLLETIRNFKFSQPSGSHDSLVEFDRLRTINEALIQSIITTCVESADAARLLAATREEPFSQQGSGSLDAVELGAIPILHAILAGDGEEVRRQWPEFVESLSPRELLYVPHSRGGDPRSIVTARSLQQLLFDLLGWLPQLGLIRETCQLLDVAQHMESEHPVGQGAVTEFDRLLENGYQAIVRSMVASAELWDDADCGKRDPHADHMLVDALQQLTEQQLERWLNHSRTLRLGVVERLAEDEDWQRFVEFVGRFGGDIFHQKFMSLGNLRGILHQTVGVWLECLEDDPEAVEEILLLQELDDGWPRDQTIDFLSIAIEAVVENYRVYRDYNTTTTQSDHGELLYTLIDFLRLRSAYDRVAWNLKPVVWAHEILIRHRRDLAAEMWCQAFAERTAEAADAHLAQLESLSQKYGMQLATVSDRIGERFIRPLLIDRVKALVEPALTANESDRQEAFAALDREIASMAAEPSGAGLDLPDWLAALEDEVTAARSRSNHEPTSDRLSHHIGQVKLTWPEVLEQLGDEA